MTHDEAFAAFRERKRAAEAERDRGRVTWRKVSSMTGGGWSGIGSGGRLVYCVEIAGYPGRIEYGIVEGRLRRRRGIVATVPEAKRLAAALLAEPEPDETEPDSARCAVCGGLNPGDVTHTRC